MRKMEVKGIRRAKLMRAKLEAANTLAFEQRAVLGALAPIPGMVPPAISGKICTEQNLDGNRRRWAEIEMSGVKDEHFPAVDRLLFRFHEEGNAICKGQAPQ